MTSMENNSKGNDLLVRAMQGGDSTYNVNLAALAKSVRVLQSCAIIINNHHTQLELTAPKRHLYSGWCELPPPPIIRPGFREVSLFRKIGGSGYGTSGVLSYDINKVYMEGNSKTQVEKRVNDGSRLFLMWSVPAGARFSTCHAVGITKKMEPSDDVFNKMYYAENIDWFIRKNYNDSLEFQETINEIPIRVLASISDGANATWKIDIC